MNETRSLLRSQITIVSGDLKESPKASLATLDDIFDNQITTSPRQTLVAVFELYQKITSDLETHESIRAHGEKIISDADKVLQMEEDSISEADMEDDRSESNMTEATEPVEAEKWEVMSSDSELEETKATREGTKEDTLDNFVVSDTAECVEFSIGGNSYNLPPSVIGKIVLQLESSKKEICAGIKDFRDRQSRKKHKRSRRLSSSDEDIYEALKVLKDDKHTQRPKKCNYIL